MGGADKVSGATVARGVIWRVIEVTGTEVLAFASFVLLARLLSPDDFGVVSQASLFILTVQLVLQQGFPEALVQMEGVDDDHFETSMWANIALGTGAALLLATAAPWLASMLSEPALAMVLVGLSPTLILLAANRIYLAKLRRSLYFHKFMLLNVIATLAGALAATILALNGYGLWSLITQQWLYALTGLIVGFACTGWLPRFRFRADHMRAMWAFSSMTVLEAMSAFCARRLDLLILAWYWSAREIGFYFLANRLLFSAGMLTYYSVSHLALPFLSRLQNDPVNFRDAIYRTMQLVSLICLPTFAGLALVAPVLIPLLFGNEWTSSVRPLQVLAALSPFYAMTLTYGQILIAAGHAKDAMILSGITMVLFLTAVASAAPYGITQAAAAGGLANILVLPIYLLCLRHRFEIDLMCCLEEQLPCLSATVSMVSVVHLVDFGLSTHVHPVLHLASLCLVGAATFLGVMIVLAKDILLGIIASFSKSNGGDQNALA